MFPTEPNDVPRSRPDGPEQIAKPDNYGVRGRPEEFPDSDAEVRKERYGQRSALLAREHAVVALHREEPDIVEVEQIRARADAWPPHSVVSPGHRNGRGRERCG
eukprot:2163704-Rhodomonas_salina.5